MITQLVVWQLEYLYFKEYFKLIATGLSKHQKIDADPEAKQQFNFTENLKNNGTSFSLFK